jgi:hypothetical protein
LKIKDEVNKGEVELSEIDSIENVLGDLSSKAASYIYLLTFRGNNAFGAKIKNEYFVITESAPNFNVYNVTQDSGLIEYYQPEKYPFTEALNQNK